MADWNTRKKEIFIPGKDTPKTYECQVCGSKIVPRKSGKYIVKDYVLAAGMANAISGAMKEEKYYDAFDCPACGCQMIAKERKPEYETECMRS